MVDLSWLYNYITVPNIIRIENSCGSISFKSLSKAFIDGTIAYGAGIVLPFILGFILFVRIPISIINMIPIIGEATLWSLFYTLAYIFITPFSLKNGTLSAKKI